MRRAVDPECETGHDAQAGLAQGLGKLVGVGRALVGGVAAADDGELVRVAQGFQIAQHIQQHRWIGDLQERRREARVAQCQKVVTV